LLRGRAKTAEGIKAAADLDRQIITLSTGAVAFTVTFLDNFKRPAGAAPGAVLTLPDGLYVAWILFGLAIFFAIFDLMGLTGTLDALDRENNGWKMTTQQRRATRGSTKHLDWSAWLMFGSFLLGVVAMGWVGFSLR
jgi:hypothetical protein